jgi:U3 small nucleolar ribonucleoprotein component
MGDKPWHLVGEVQGSSRPLNSALEIDMDYDTTNKPPPAPTEEATHSLEDMIKKRIADRRCAAEVYISILCVYVFVFHTASGFITQAYCRQQVR